MRADPGRIEVTNLHLYECHMNLLGVLRYILCPIGNVDFQNYITRQNVKGVLEGHFGVQGEQRGHLSTSTDDRTLVLAVMILQR